MTTRLSVAILAAAFMSIPVSAEDGGVHREEVGPTFPHGTIITIRKPGEHGTRRVRLHAPAVVPLGRAARLPDGTCGHRPESGGVTSIETRSGSDNYEDPKTGGGDSVQTTGGAFETDPETCEMVLRIW
jgi:hypothetical protein